jgi:hypothetical protein
MDHVIQNSFRVMNFQDKFLNVKPNKFVGNIYFLNSNAYFRKAVMLFHKRIFIFYTNQAQVYSVLGGGF